MPTKKPSSIEIEDASLLSMLAYQLRTRRKTFDVNRFLDQLKSDRARQIGRVIVGNEESAASDAIEQAAYYTKWAAETARTARAASRRPGSSRRRTG